MSEINPIRPTTPEAIDLAKTLLRSSRYGALAVIDAMSGRALASRVAVATDVDGTPIILVSGLAAHTSALLANPACSLLLGEVGKGDPLAHARMTIHCDAVKVERGTTDYAQFRRRYINHNPKGSLYVDLGDFAFFRLNAENASLNGGFGKAFKLDHDDLICDKTAAINVATEEQKALDTINEKYGAEISAYIRSVTDSSAKWKITGLDPDGATLASGDQIVRLGFSSSCDSIKICCDTLLKRLMKAK